MSNLTTRIGSHMELLATLGMTVPETLPALTQACTTALLNGGKLILLSDSESQHCKTLLAQQLNKGENIERPALPTLNLDVESGLPGTLSADMLEHVYQSNDFIIVFARSADTLPSSIQTDHNVYVVSAQAITSNTAGNLNLGINNRSQWLLATTLICSLLAQDIEQQLFGFQAHD